MTDSKRVPELRFKADDGSEFPEWEEKKLGEITSIKRGASPRPISDSKWFSESGGRGWVRISDVSAGGKFLTRVTQYLSFEGVERSVKVDPNELIMSIAGSVGKPAIVQIPVCIHDGFIALKELKASVDFIYYLLEGVSQKWGKLTQSSSQSNLNSEIVSSLPAFLPSLPEQKKIAEFFSLLDERISKQVDKVTSLREYKKGLSQRIFSRELRFKDENGEDYPEWEEKKLGEALSPIKYEPVQNADEYKLLTVKLHTKGVITTDKSPAITLSGRPYYKRSNGELLIGKQNLHNGGFGIVPPEADGYICSNAISGFTSNEDINFIVHYLDGSYRGFEKYTEGTGAKEIPQRAFDAIPLSIPSLPEQEKIAALLSTMDSKIAKEEEKLTVLREQKRGLMQRMFV